MSYVSTELRYVTHEWLRAPGLLSIISHLAALLFLKKHEYVTQSFFFTK